MALRISKLAASAAADEVVGALDGGTVEVRTGSAPAACEDADTGTLLAVCTFGTPAFAAAVDGVATANAIAPDASANATGTASHFRAKTPASAVVFQGSVTGIGGGGDMQVSNTSIVAAIPFTITSCVYTHPLA
jgi:hypothetical protein